ncbi:MAG: methylmalonyl-CoA epimerase [Bacteroidales bacterium]|jgi:methylmalonyl-CoA/ethylmalonyl-CoA epimerase|nr:methylmalonyl-CoA epimerase [Bacteroidales bacterium]
MKPSHIEHIGIAVENLDEAIKFWENVLGLKCYNIEEVADQKVRTAFIQLGEVKIELLEPTSTDSPIAGFLEKRGSGIHHLALAVDNADQALKEVEEKGLRLIDKQSRKGAENLNIGFVHPKSALGILMEFCSK